MAKFDEENPDDFMKWIAAFRHKYKGLHNAPNGNPHGERGLCVGLSTYQDADRDNGVYIIEGWKIVGRESFEGQEQEGHDLLGMLRDINETMPKGIQLNEHELEDAAEGADA